MFVLGAAAGGDEYAGVDDVVFVAPVAAWGALEEVVEVGKCEPAPDVGLLVEVGDDAEEAEADQPWTTKSCVASSVACIDILCSPLRQLESSLMDWTCYLACCGTLTRGGGFCLLVTAELVEETHDF